MVAKADFKENVLKGTEEVLMYFCEENIYKVNYFKMYKSYKTQRSQQPSPESAECFMND